MWIFQNPAGAGLDPDTFAPTDDLDFDQWLDTAVSIGAQYAMLTTTTVHQGFALWPTEYYVPGHDPYSIAQSAWYAANGSPDIVGQFVQKCRDKGLHPCLSYSIWDKTYESWSGTDETTDAAAYIAKIEAQLTELLTNYGEIYAIWFDGWKWHMGYEEIPFDTIHDFIKGISPNTIVIDNNKEHPAQHGMITVYEEPIDGSIPGGNVTPAEELQSIRLDDGWACFPGIDNSAGAMKSVANLNSAISSAVSNNGTFLLNLTPCADGVVPQSQIDIVNQLVIP